MSLVASVAISSERGNLLAGAGGAPYSWPLFVDGFERGSALLVGMYAFGAMT